MVLSLKRPCFGLTTGLTEVCPQGDFGTIRASCPVDASWIALSEDVRSLFCSWCYVQCLACSFIMCLLLFVVWLAPR